MCSIVPVKANVPQFAGSTATYNNHSIDWMFKESAALNNKIRFHLQWFHNEDSVYNSLILVSKVAPAKRCYNMKMASKFTGLTSQKQKPVMMYSMGGNM